MSCHACTRVAWADPYTVAATRFVAVEKVLEVSAKSGGVELPEPITMGTSIVLADCIDEHVLTWHRVVSPAGSIRRVLSGPWLGADGAPGSYGANSPLPDGYLGASANASGVNNMLRTSRLIHIIGHEASLDTPSSASIAANHEGLWVGRKVKNQSEEAFGGFPGCPVKLAWACFTSG